MVPWYSWAAINTDMNGKIWGAPSTFGLLSIRIRMEGRDCGALVQFGCTDMNKHEGFHLHRYILG